jgi:hypothetical protein
MVGLELLYWNNISVCVDDKKSGRGHTLVLIALFTL